MGGILSEQALEETADVLAGDADQGAIFEAGGIGHRHEVGGMCAQRKRPGQ